MVQMVGNGQLQRMVGSSLSWMIVVNFKGFYGEWKGLINDQSSPLLMVDTWSYSPSPFHHSAAWLTNSNMGRLQLVEIFNHQPIWTTSVATTFSSRQCTIKSHYYKPVANNWFSINIRRLYVDSTSRILGNVRYQLGQMIKQVIDNPVNDSYGTSVTRLSALQVEISGALKRTPQLG